MSKAYVRCAQQHITPTNTNIIFNEKGEGAKSYEGDTSTMAPTSPQSKNIYVADDSGDSINYPKPKVTTKEKYNGKIDPVLCSIMYDTALASKQALRIIQQTILLTTTMDLVFLVVIR